MNQYDAKFIHNGSHYPFENKQAISDSLGSIIPYQMPIIAPNSNDYMPVWQSCGSGLGFNGLNSEAKKAEGGAPTNSDRSMNMLRVSVSFVLISFSLVGFASFPQSVSFGGQRLEGTCPSVIVNLPNYAVSSRRPVPLGVLIVDARKILGDEAAGKIQVSWQSSEGGIVAGSGGDNFLLDVSSLRFDENHSIQLSVVITGMPPECGSRVRGSVNVNRNCYPPKLLDEYGDVTAGIERNHLDSFVRTLKRNEHLTGYVVAYAGPDACPDEGHWLGERARDYLIGKWSIPRNRITTVDGGYRKGRAIQLYLSDENNCGPAVMPAGRTENHSTTMFCKDKYPDELR